MVHRHKSIGYLVFRVSTDFRLALERRTREYGLGVSDALLLRTLNELGPSSLVELAVAVEIPHPSIVRQIDALERAGYARRTVHAEDRRVKVVSITPEGERILPELVDVFREVHREATRGLSPEMVETLTATLRTIHHNFCPSPMNGEDGAIDSADGGAEEEA